MARKKRPSAEQLIEELAEIAVRNLSRFSEEEQERRILAAEKLLATASRAGSPRTSSSTLRTRRTRAAVRSR
jgi:hypothetical protein